MVILTLVAIAMPWHEVGQRVFEFPRPRFHEASWCGVSCMGYEGFAVVTVDGRGDPGVPLERLEVWVHDQRDRGLRSFYLRAHRAAPWSAVARVLEAVALAGLPSIGLQVGPAAYLTLELTAEAPDTTITAVPLPDPEGTLAAARARGKARSAGPVLGLAVPVDPDLESVLQALECYAGDDVAVRLAVRR